MTSMSASSLFGRASRLALVTAAAGFALAACQQSAAPPANNTVAPTPLAALPLAMDASNATIAPAPSAEALPPASAARVGRLADPRAAYAFADRAAEMNAG